ncbi:MAG: class A beta-lactamase-related serine hydrolase, partial [Elusimicrobia bacterium]|nr:class A beta-lactamase-related serine hydrolase [Elusimicrobiota bacterium]
PSGAGAQPRARWDVCYVDHADAAAAWARREAVAKLLGPRVRRRLHVVQSEGGYGVVYVRRGEADAARATAAAHTRLLETHGLGKAVAVASQPWTIIHKSGAKNSVTPERAKETEAADVSEKEGLEALVVKRVEQLRRAGRLASDERAAWSVYDFTTGETLAEINADIKLQSASLIKPFVALAYFDRVKEGALVYDGGARKRLERMIQRSDNASANWAMRRLGGPDAVQSLLKTRYGSMLDGVQIHEYIPSGGREYRNMATARDYSRFLLALWRDELPGSAELKRLMGLPKRDRIHTRVPLPSDTEVYSKTGSTSRLCGDIGVVLAKGPDGKRYAYTLVGIIEKQHAARHYARWLRSRGDVIRDISGLVYRRIGLMHGLPPAGQATRS